ncbi:hypothetical protein H0H81_006096 [Sphagnurus paluster]|uniref:Polysaccharide lyase 14 domain-containing protein n=1 Tax=Sphagnurus paluster TaxID=117069 RepID=A0A9P7G2A1_9AGAR|nr:hypothetical protein H0H81_006096 [Sphagnurus paluster]
MAGTSLGASSFPSVLDASSVPAPSVVWITETVFRTTIYSGPATESAPQSSRLRPLGIIIPVLQNSLILSALPTVWVTETVSETLATETTSAPTESRIKPLDIILPFLTIVPSTSTASLIWVTKTISESLPTIPPENSQHALEIIIPFLPVFTPATPEEAPSPQPTELLTVTETLTVTVSASSEPPTLTPAPPAPPAPTRLWKAPVQMQDLHAFNISKFSSGRTNLKIVHHIPPSAFDPNLASATDTDTTTNDDDDDTPPPPSLLRLFYPAGSINPAQRPVGGAQFYATPLELRGARSVTLTYSVFFPADFSWVLAGKLPGLYGGRAGCSGGSAARDCFSTRLMWRKHGLGELYLYAPKEEQTGALCADPQSVCDAAYGFSIGRGSFRWAAGAWTTVQQTVTLNTPGQQDGRFTLDVNGERVIERDDIYYRGVPPREVHTVTPGAATTKLGLGGLIGTLLSGLLRRETRTEAGYVTPTTAAAGQAEEDVVQVVIPMNDAQRQWKIPATPTITGTTTTTTKVGEQEPTFLPLLLPMAHQAITVETEGEPVGFIGLFFSTFFGGHDFRYASPRDQYVWFKDFALSYNS